MWIIAFKIWVSWSALSILWVLVAMTFDSEFRWPRWVSVGPAFVSVGSAMVLLGILLWSAP